MRRGFTLVEIMVVVGVVSVLMLLTLPNFMRSRMVASETAAIANLKTLSNSCQAFYSTIGNYPTALTDLVLPVSNPAYIDVLLASGSKQNYSFTYATTDGQDFSIHANPAGILANLGGRYFFVDQNGAIRVKIGAEAGPSDALMQ